MVLLEMEHCAAYPSDLLEPLGLAIAIDAKTAVAISVDKIKLYEMYDTDNDSFLGSFYALKYNGAYYGNIVGSRDIILCNPKKFRFVETEKLIIPLHNDGKNLLAFSCHYAAGKEQPITVKQLEKRSRSMQSTEILHIFEPKTTFETALSFCEQNFLQNEKQKH